MSFSVKLLNNGQVVRVVAIDGQAPVVLQAERGLQYQLIDNALGGELAPENIIARRVNNDLYINFDDGDADTDLIIENYYDNAGSQVIGLHENGQIYNYVPTSEQSIDAINALPRESVAEQVLGGESYGAGAFAGASSGFNPLYLAGVLPLVALGAAGGGGGGSDDDNNTSTTPAPNIELGLENNIAIATITTNLSAVSTTAESVVTIKNGTTEQSITIAKNTTTGEYEVKSSNGLSASDYSIDKTTGDITIKNAFSTNNTEITVETKDNGATVAKAEKTITTVNQVDLQNDTGTSNADYISNDGALDTDGINVQQVVATSLDSATGTLIYTPINKNTQGKYILPEGKYSEVIIITENVIYKSSQEIIIITTAPADPEITVQQGEIIVQLPKNAAAGEKVEINYTKDGETQKTTITLEKQSDGSWTSTDPSVVIDSNEKVSIKTNTLKDSTEVEVKITDIAGNTSENEVAVVKTSEAAEKLVAEAERLEQAAKDAIANADEDGNGLITPEEAKAAQDAIDAYEAAKEVAEDAVKVLPDSVKTEKDGLQGRLDKLDNNLQAPAVTDVDGNGIADKDQLAAAPYFVNKNGEVITDLIVDYFENSTVDDVLGRILAKGTDGTVKSYEFVDGSVEGNYSVSKDGAYKIDMSTGEIYLTIKGGALAKKGDVASTNVHNDFETGANTFSGYQVKIIDGTGSSAVLDVTMQVDNVIAIEKLRVNLNDETGINQSGNENSTDKSDANYQFTSDGNDRVLIGYDEEFGSAGSTTVLGRGIGHGAGLLTGAGDDEVIIAQAIGGINHSGSVDLGSGDNFLKTNFGIMAGGFNNYITGSWRSWVVSEDGDDFLVFGNYNGRDNVHTNRSGIANSTILTGAGNDTLVVRGGSIETNSVIDMGAGDDVIRLTNVGVVEDDFVTDRDQIVGAQLSIDGDLGVANHIDASTSGADMKDSILVLGEGNDIFEARAVSGSLIIAGKATVNGYDSDSKYYNSAGKNAVDDGTDTGNDTLNIMTYSSTTAYMGKGDDVVRVNNFGGTIYMEDGDDTLEVKTTMSGGTVNMGTGDDKVEINSMLGGTLDMGAGDDIVKINTLTNVVAARNTKVELGAGDDVLTIGTMSVKGAAVNTMVDTGAGDDTVNIGHKDLAGSMNGGTINFGEGNDTLNVYGSVSRGTIDLGDGADTVNIGSDKIAGSMIFGTINLGEGNDTVNIGHKDLAGSMTGGTINLGAGNDTVTYHGTALGGKIDGGDGTDTFTLGENVSGATISLANLQNFEIIDLTGGGDNTLTNVNRANVTSGTPLYIKGDAGDTVDLGNQGSGSDLRDTGASNRSNRSDWILQTQTVEEGTGENKITYNVYQNSYDNNQVVYIQQGVEVI